MNLMYFASADYWNCTKRYAREKCDYTMKGLMLHLPTALLFVNPYWVRKAFERSDRFLALYDMETSTVPFALREFMVKCWKRHRDVPTKIQQLVDKAIDDLQTRKTDLTRRSAKNKIKLEPLEKFDKHV
jgi:hypothetical protein